MKMRAENNVVACELGELRTYLGSKANFSLILCDLTGFGPSFLLCVMKISQVLYSSKILLVCDLIHLGNKLPDPEENVISAHWLFYICLRPSLTHTPSNILIKSANRLSPFWRDHIKMSCFELPNEFPKLAATKDRY